MAFHLSALAWANIRLGMTLRMSDLFRCCGAPTFPLSNSPQNTLTPGVSVGRMAVAFSLSGHGLPFVSAATRHIVPRLIL